MIFAIHYIATIMGIVKMVFAIVLKVILGNNVNFYYLFQG